MVPCAWFVGYISWWIFPVIMIAMIIFCFFMIRRHGMSCWMGCCGGKHRLNDDNDPSLR